ncbi:MAG TPA: DNA-directed RNA polymerase subunit omega [Blastocatellia bacterium]|nr:DNA-directed RNA polymerase subunit omega [Blastocatellia bacterium]
MKNVTSDNRFLKVLITAQRAKQIHKGARPLVQNSNARATRIALEEVERGLINYEFVAQVSDLRSGRDVRDVSGRDDGKVNREVANQLSVERLLSAG